MKIPGAVLTSVAVTLGVLAFIKAFPKLNPVRFVPQVWPKA